MKTLSHLIWAALVGFLSTALAICVVQAREDSRQLDHCRDTNIQLRAGMDRAATMLGRLSDDGGTR